MNPPELFASPLPNCTARAHDARRGHPPWPPSPALQWLVCLTASLPFIQCNHDAHPPFVLISTASLIRECELAAVPRYHGHQAAPHWGQAAPENTFLSRLSSWLRLTVVVLIGSSFSLLHHRTCRNGGLAAQFTLPHLPSTPVGTTVAPVSTKHHLGIVVSSSCCLSSYSNLYHTIAT